LQSLRRHPVPSSSRRRKRTSHQQNTHARCFPMGRHHLGIRGRLFLGIGGRDHFGIRGRIASEFACRRSMPRPMPAIGVYCAQRSRSSELRWSYGSHSQAPA
ncbi:hypothetical protein CN175_29295, partial [Sinorhizobium meliloti]